MGQRFHSEGAEKYPRIAKKLNQDAAPRRAQVSRSCVLVSLDIVRMFWWFLIVAVAAGAVVWAGLSAYIQVRKRLKRAENLPHEAEHEAGDRH